MSAGVRATARQPALLPRPLALLTLLAGLLTLLVLAPAAPAAAAPTGAPYALAARAVAVVDPVAPVAPVPPAGSDRTPGAVTPTTPSPAGTPVDIGGLTTGATSNPVMLALLLGAISLLPAGLVMVTAFTRIVIVLGFTRSALGTQGVPPTQVLIGLALFLTMFVMAPVFSSANDQALQPYLRGEIDQSQAFDRGLEPFRGFMLEQVRESDLQLFVDMSGKGAPATPADVPTTTLIPAFLISELRTAFLIGFIVFVPFVVIDLVVSAALSAMGMAMLPPSLISLPFKLLLFVAVDGWYLLVSSLVRSFA